MTVNWGLLVQQGRCKAFGVPWSDEEVHARYVLGIDADLVRKGVLTLEENKDELDALNRTDHKTLRSMKAPELEALATELGITLPEGVKRLEVIKLITQLSKSNSETSQETPVEAVKAPQETPANEATGESKLPESDTSDVQESLEE